MKQLIGIVLVFLLGLQAGCATVPDPALRVAYCIEDTLKKHKSDPEPLQAVCVLDVHGGYIVVFHPDGNLTSEQLLAAGLSKRQADQVRELRGGTNAAIYVLSNDPATPNSRTTYQHSFVRIPQVLVATKSAAESLKVNLAGEPQARFVKSVE